MPAAVSGTSVRALAASVGIPARLRDAGVREEDLPRIATKAFEDASHRGSQWGVHGG